MSKLNHTSGPWFPAKFYGPGECRRVVGPNNEQIGSFNETPDAILAAAAPDLLKELRLLLLITKCACSSTEEFSLELYWKRRCQRCATAKDAIAKAYGEKND